MLPGYQVLTRKTLRRTFLAYVLKEVNDTEKTDTQDDKLFLFKI